MIGRRRSFHGSFTTVDEPSTLNADALEAPRVRGYFNAPSPPLRVVEDTPGVLRLETDFSAQRLCLYVLLHSTLILLTALGTFCAFYYGFPLFDWFIGRQVFVAGGALVTWFAVGGAVMAIIVVGAMAIATLRELRRRGTEFDRNAGCVRFGPAGEQFTRPLSDVASLEVYAVNSVDVVIDRLNAWEAANNKRPPPGPAGSVRQFILFFAKLRARTLYQLDLVYKDSGRRYVTVGQSREPVDAVARQIADFVRVPFIENW
jgi:hypothetical protein